MFVRGLAGKEEEEATCKVLDQAKNLRDESHMQMRMSSTDKTILH